MFANILSAARCNLANNDAPAIEAIGNLMSAQAEMFQRDCGFFSLAECEAQNKSARAQAPATESNSRPSMNHSTQDPISACLVDIITDGFNRSFRTLVDAGALDDAKMRKHY